MGTRLVWSYIQYIIHNLQNQATYMKELKLPNIIMQHIPSNLSGYFYLGLRPPVSSSPTLRTVSGLVYWQYCAGVLRSVPFVLFHSVPFWCWYTLVAGILVTSLKKIDGASWVPACRARRALSRSGAGIRRYRAVLHVFQVSFP